MVNTIIVLDAVSNTQTVSTIDALMADGGQATIGSKTDAANTFTNTTAVSAMSVLKQISASVQTQANTTTTQPVSMADGVNVTFGAKTDAANTFTNTTSISAMSVFKQISASVQAQANATTPQLAKITDGTSNAAVKAASTAPAATDPALVVTVNPLAVNPLGYYVSVPASNTALTLQSSTGATGDYIAGILIIPASTSPGAVVLLDNATSMTVFAGGGSSLTNLVPFYIPLGAVSRSGAWKITTGAQVSAIAVGKFS